jgi:hypothetical protein
MRPIILLIVTLGLFVHPAFGQDTTKVSTIEKVRALDNDVQELKDYVKSQKIYISAGAQNNYEKNYNRMLSMAELVNELNSTINLIENDKKQSSTFNKINQANNPSSDILGFKLTDVINTSLDETLKERNVSPEKAKPVKNIISNLTYGFSSFFPPLQLVSSIISGISAYTDKTIIPYPANLDGKIKHINDIVFKENVSSMDTAFIGTFTRKLGPYISFYVELNKVNTGFDEDLSKFSFFYADFVNDIKQLKGDFEKNTSIQLQNSITLQVNKIMNYSSSGSREFKHADYNHKPEITYINENLETMYEFVKIFNEYSKQYIFLVNRNIDNNKAQLKNALKLPKHNKESISNLLKKIDEEQVGTEQNPGFITKYNKNISSITSKIKELKRN